MMLVHLKHSVKNIAYKVVCQRTNEKLTAVFLYRTNIILIICMDYRIVQFENYNYYFNYIYWAS